MPVPMLTIKRVPTIVSCHLEEEEEEGSVNVQIKSKIKAIGCGGNCIGKCCLPASKLPLYAFKNDEHEFLETCIHTSTTKGRRPISFLSSLLLGLWEERMDQGLFRYDVTTCETQIIPGNYGFIAQLNEGRQSKKRPTEFRVDQVLQPFDGSKFNFTKVSQEEVLFRFEPSNDMGSHFIPTSSVNPHSSLLNAVAINVSPIEYGHVLLIPRVLDCLPQRIDHETFFLALCMAKEADDPFFRVGYNSLGAFATINHLHFQAYYLSVPFPVEKAPTHPISNRKQLPDNGVVVSQLLNYPVRGLLFEGGTELRDLSNTVSNSCVSLQNKNIPFNVLIADCGRRIFLFPQDSLGFLSWRYKTSASERYASRQCYAEKQATGAVPEELLNTQVNPAVWEIVGHMVLKRRKDYDDASEENACKLLAELSLSEERFRTVKTIVLEAAGLQEVKLSGSIVNDEEESLPSPRGPCVASSQLPQEVV